MSTWTLLILIWSGDRPVFVPGFTTKAHCEAAAAQVRKDLTAASTSCLEVK